MSKHTKLEKIFTFFSIVFAVLFAVYTLIDTLGFFQADIMILGFIIAFMLISIGIASMKANKLLGIICLIVSAFICLEAAHFYSPFLWFKF